MAVATTLPREWRMGTGRTAGWSLRPLVSEGSLIGSARLGVRLVGSRGLVLHQKCFNPVVMAFLQDPVCDGGCIFRHLEALAERLGEPFQSRPGEAAQGGQDLADRGRIQGGKSRVGRSSCCRKDRCAPEGWLR